MFPSVQLEQILKIELDLVRNLGIDWNFENKEYFEFIRFYDLYCKQVEEERMRKEKDSLTMSRD